MEFMAQLIIGWRESSIEFTAIASIITAILLFQLVAKALALPSPECTEGSDQKLNGPH